MVDSEPVAGVHFMLYSIMAAIDLKVCVCAHACVCEGGDGVICR